MSSKMGTMRNTKKSIRLAASLCAVATTLMSWHDTEARDVNYTGEEAIVHVKPGEPTQVTFPAKIEGGYKRVKDSALVLERQGNFLIVFAQPKLGLEGESIIVHLDDKRSYALRLVPATGDVERDVSVKVLDSREGEVEEEAVAHSGTDKPSINNGEFPPPSTVAGLMREMVLTAEFGKQRAVPGYRRSNKFTGETVLSDGTLLATIDEIFMGTDYWGYVLSVENKVDTTQRINPATFRLDGTRAVSATRWELAPTPLTEEQKIAAQHRGKIYIVTRAKRG